MNTSASTRKSSTPEEVAYGLHFGIAAHLATLLAQLATGRVTAALAVHICALRRAMEPEAIDTVRGGYQLTEIGQDECRTARDGFKAWVNKEDAA